MVLPEPLSELVVMVGRVNSDSPVSQGMQDRESPQVPPRDGKNPQS